MKYSKYLLVVLMLMSSICSTSPTAKAYVKGINRFSYAYINPSVHHFAPVECVPINNTSSLWPWGKWSQGCGIGGIYPPLLRSVANGLSNMALVNDGFGRLASYFGKPGGKFSLTFTNVNLVSGAYTITYTIRAYDTAASIQAGSLMQVRAATTLRDIVTWVDPARGSIFFNSDTGVTYTLSNGSGLEVVVYKLTGTFSQVFVTVPPTNQSSRMTVYGFASQDDYARYRLTCHLAPDPSSFFLVPHVEGHTCGWAAVFLKNGLGEELSDFDDVENASIQAAATMLDYLYAGDKVVPTRSFSASDSRQFSASVLQDTIALHHTSPCSFTDPMGQIHPGALSTLTDDYQNEGTTFFCSNNGYGDTLVGKYSGMSTWKAVQTAWPMVFQGGQSRTLHQIWAQAIYNKPDTTGPQVFLSRVFGCSFGLLNEETLGSGTEDWGGLFELGWFEPKGITTTNPFVWPPQTYNCLTR